MDTNVAQKGKQNFWPAILTGSIMLVLCAGLFLMTQMKHPISQKNSAPSVTAQANLLALPETKANAFYQNLRFVDLMGNHVTMLRHLPTGQRIILLSGRQDNDTVYQSFYNQNLTPLQFTVLIELFKQHSSFENKNIHINSVTLKKTGVFTEKNMKIPYKYYEIPTSVDGTPEVFEAYLGKIEDGPSTRGLIFTFNSKNHAALSPVTDLFKVIKPLTTDKSA